MDDLVEQPRARMAAWLIDPLLANRAIYLKVALAAAMINLFGLASSLFVMTVYDRVVPSEAIASLVALSIGLAIVVVFEFILRTLRAYFVDIAGARIDREIGEDIFARLIAIRLETRRGSTGALAGLLRELETLRDFFTSATLVAIVDVPFIVLTIALIALIGGAVVFVPLVMIPVVILIGWLTHPALDRLSARALGEGLVKQSVLVETIGTIETVKTAGAGTLLARRWRDAIDRHADSSLRQRLVSNIAVTVANSANTISYCGVVIVGVVMVMQHQITLGALVACSMLASRAMAPLAQIANLLSRISATRTAYRQINEIMEKPVEGPAGEAIAPATIDGRIEFRNVGFRYPAATERALNGVSFTVNPGEHVALLGRVGSGKSTIARLIVGLYPVEEGAILIDGTDIRQIDPVALRGWVGAAMQESVLLTGSVQENIALGRPHIDKDEVMRAATISGTHQFMRQLANGYDLRLADRGEGLSGGQRQSIALARALAGRPQILLFDEPSSAMDAASEAGLIDRLTAELKGRTLVLITHRPALLRLVDRILLFDGGKLVVDGPRDEVLRRIAAPKAAS